MPDECVIWGEPAKVKSGEGDYSEITSDRAGGSYRVTGSVIEEVQRLPDDQKALLTTWLVDERRHGNAPPIIDTGVLLRLSELRPLRLQERKDRLLLLLKSENDDVGHRFTTSDPSKPKDADRLVALLGAWTGSRNRKEVVWLIEELVKDHFLHRPGGQRHDFTIDSRGWERLEEIQYLHVPSKQGFVAMWFDPSMTAAFDDGFAPAIRECGYVPMRIDSKEHANKIDDEIILEIRRSRFVVADFTSEPDKPRGGVYFEAGFAMGLNIPVIWSCKSALINQVHFDTRQFNHITWDDPSELCKKLRIRIGAVIGDARS